MREQAIELSVGDVVQIGDRLLAVVDIDGEEVTFRIETLEGEECLLAGAAAGTLPAR